MNIGTHLHDFLISLWDHKTLKHLDLRDNNIQEMRHIAHLICNN